MGLVRDKATKRGADVFRHQRLAVAVVAVDLAGGPSEQGDSPDLQGAAGELPRKRRSRERSRQIVRKFGGFQSAHIAREAVAEARASAVIDRLRDPYTALTYPQNARQYGVVREKCAKALKQSRF
jgi:hypothetical protein